MISRGATAAVLVLCVELVDFARGLATSVTAGLTALDEDFAAVLGAAAVKDTTSGMIVVFLGITFIGLLSSIPNANKRTWLG